MLLRYEPNPNGSVDSIAGVTNAEGNVAGLMPHPEHAVDELLGSTDGRVLLAGLLGRSRPTPEIATLAPQTHCAQFERRHATAPASQPRSHRRRAGANPGTAGARSQRLRAGGVLALVERALRLQALAAPAEAAAQRRRCGTAGPGRERRSDRRRRRLGVALKVESHNHPSAVEPFQGAATGVGGILRDIFAMGARPIAILDSLRFGELEADGQKRLFQGVVDGVGHYGNCVGVANVGGEVVFDEPYSTTAWSTRCASVCCRSSGSSPPPQPAPATWWCCTARAPAATGSAAPACSPPRDSTRARAPSGPSVQIGDPFTGKKLIECTLALLDADLVVSLQDLGAAGLASSTAEMASSGGVGLDIDLGRVPLREAGHGAVRDHDLGIAGADGGDRRPRPLARSGGAVRPLGPRRHGDRRGHRPRPPARVSPRRRGW